MADTILGNNQAPAYFLKWLSAEDDDGNEFNIQGEMVDECCVFGYRTTTPKASESTNVRIGFYYKPPVSEWYWDYCYGDPYYPIIPLVYSCDSNWNLSERLNQNVYEVKLDGCSEGWIIMDVTLKRKLIQNEKLVFGVYSDQLGIVSTHDYDPTGNCYVYFSKSVSRLNYSSQIDFITGGDWIKGNVNVEWEYDGCIYLEYENKFEGKAYTKILAGNVGAVTKTERRNYIRRGEKSKSIFTSLTFRGCGKKICKKDEFALSDIHEYLRNILRLCKSNNNLIEKKEHSANYKRCTDIVLKSNSSTLRSWKALRKTDDQLDFYDLPYAGRLIYRAVQSVMSFWDWLRGKIREANNVVSFYCPITLEIEMESCL